MRVHYRRLARNTRDAASASPLHVDRGGDLGYLPDYPGGVAVPGEVFRPIHVAGPEAVERAIPQANFRLAGQGDDVLPPGRGVPVRKRARWRRTEHHALGTVERGQLWRRCQSELFQIPPDLMALYHLQTRR